MRRVGSKSLIRYGCTTSWARGPSFLYQRWYSSSGARVPEPYNEPILTYIRGSRELSEIQKEVANFRSTQTDIPLIIGGKEIRTGKTQEFRVPHDHKHVLGQFHCAGPQEIQQAIEASLEAKKAWQSMSWESRASIFLKAADIIAGPWRQVMNAATVLGQSKNFVQAEVDAACETIDFLRFNTHFAQKIYSGQPISPPGSGVWNRLSYRPLEGFVYAVTPFNFSAIGANLCAAPAMMGNTVVWKPSSASSVLNNYYMMKVFEEAGLPPGVINMINGDPAQISEIVLKNRNFAGLHYTGSTEVFRSLWKQTANNLEHYNSYPRIVGETGGKDFIFAHRSADVDQLVTGIIRGSFEFAGQKCSASSRAYVPQNLWEGGVKDKLISEMKKVKCGNPEDPTVLVNAVIHERSFENCKKYLDYVKTGPGKKDHQILVGGDCDKSVGYFVQPTIVVTTDPKSKLMSEEIFGPIVTIYVYPTEQYEQTLKVCDETSPFALTGAIFARERTAVDVADRILENAAGNFYINDKPTGAVVGQQPFGGGRASGTNDKAGFETNLNKWVSVRAIKETFVAPKSFAYPSMAP